MSASPSLPLLSDASPATSPDASPVASPRAKKNDEGELLLRENKQRFVLFPIQYDAIWKMYKKHMASFWAAEELDLAHDYKDFCTLSADEQHFIKVRGRSEGCAWCVRTGSNAACAFFVIKARARFLRGE
jgi:hypothetical protein